MVLRFQRAVRESVDAFRDWYCLPSLGPGASSGSADRIVSKGLDKATAVRALVYGRICRLVCP